MEREEKGQTVLRNPKMQLIEKELISNLAGGEENKGSKLKGTKREPFLRGGKSPGRKGSKQRRPRNSSLPRGRV